VLAPADAIKNKIYITMRLRKGSRLDLRLALLLFFSKASFGALILALALGVFLPRRMDLAAALALGFGLTYASRSGNVEI